MKNYNEFSIKTVPFNCEIVSGALWQLDIEGINEFDDHLAVFAYEEKEITKEMIEEVLESLKDEKLIDSFSIAEGYMESKNWNEEWEKNVKVIEVTDKIVIKPSFKEYAKKEGQIIIGIDPKMSFGTGDHATTKLVLQFCEKYVNAGQKVLDVGCGTGVLAIGSVLLGADKAVGIDNDEWCLLNGTENVQLNNLADKVEVRLCEVKNVAEDNFDLILANINKHILIEIRDELVKKIKADGIIILSGLLFIDEDDIVSFYTAAGLKLIEKNRMEEWIALVFKKN